MSWPGMVEGAIILIVVVLIFIPMHLNQIACGLEFVVKKGIPAVIQHQIRTLSKAFR